MKLTYPTRVALFLVAAALLLTPGQSQAATLVPMLADATLDTAFGKSMGILARFAYLGAYGGLVLSGWQIMQGKAEGAKFMILGGIVCACASLIVKALFATGDTAVTITPQM